MRERSLLLSYYLAVSSLFEPEFSNQRIAWAKTAALVETVRSYFANIEKSCELRKAFIHDFNNTSENSIYANHGRYSVGKKLLGTLVEALKQLMLDVENALGKDIYPQLHQAVLWVGEDMML
ncbi:ent-copalyl diphosphate synthase 5-like [Apium graveolens]|uniref:ent-copalyl diphosphate synthase 5-like n=1 Tax=Apium graveolens TaxID=4045 RepID=UPI003D7AD692